MYNIVKPPVDNGQVLGGGGPHVGRMGGRKDGDQGAGGALRPPAVGQPPLHAGRRRLAQGNKEEAKLWPSYILRLI